MEYVGSLEFVEVLVFVVTPNTVEASDSVEGLESEMALDSVEVVPDSVDASDSVEVVLDSVEHGGTEKAYTGPPVSFAAKSYFS
uniref:Uncharacterized protein n=1 Tax=Leersia perrieri TaxID=77586 RepID=A0A0D9XY47_9ORYZ